MKLFRGVAQGLLLLLLISPALGQVEITEGEVSSGDFILGEQGVSYRFVIRGSRSGGSQADARVAPYYYVIYATGVDMYGNPFYQRLAQGQTNELFGEISGENSSAATSQTFEGFWNSNDTSLINYFPLRPQNPQKYSFHQIVLRLYGDGVTASTGPLNDAQFAAPAQQRVEGEIFWYIRESQGPDLQCEGVTYNSGTYREGDVIRITTTVRNRIFPLAAQRSEIYKIHNMLSSNALVDWSPPADPNNPPDQVSDSPIDDFLLAEYTMAGDRPVVSPSDLTPIIPDGSTVVRTVQVAGTPGPLPTYGIRNPNLPGEQYYNSTLRFYQPQPDDGWFDVGETVSVTAEVKIPQNYSGTYFVAARVDPDNKIPEPVNVRGFNTDIYAEITPGEKDNNTFISSASAKVTIEGPSPSPTIEPVSAISFQDGEYVQGGGQTSDLSVANADGTIIAFSSSARNLLVPPQLAEAFVRSRGRKADMSVTGNYPASFGGVNVNYTDVEPYLTSGQQIFYRLQQTRENFLASGFDDVEANANCHNPAMSSANARYIAYDSRASNLGVDNNNNRSFIYVTDIDTGDIVVVSRAGGTGSGTGAVLGALANGDSFNPSISANGRFVTFESTARNLDTSVALPVNSPGQIYLHDRDANNDGIFDEPGEGNTATYLVSVNGSGTPANGTCLSPVVNVDESGAVMHVAYVSTAANLLSGGIEQVYRISINVTGPVRGADPATLLLVSENTNGDRSNRPDGAPNGSIQPSISGDGSQIAFSSSADNLVYNPATGTWDGDTNQVPDVFVRNLSVPATDPEFDRKGLVRVSESIPRLATGTISFAGPSQRVAGNASRVNIPVNNPQPGDALQITTGGVTRSFVFLLPSVVSVTVDNGGSGYVTAPAVTIVGGGGSGATATAVLGTGATAGRVDRIVMTNFGSDYTSVPDVVVAAPPAGNRAIATAVLGPPQPRPVGSIEISDPGSGYTSAPDVTIAAPSAPGGTQATAIAILGTGANAGRVIRVDMLNGGSGYLTPPLVTISGGGGIGATADAILSIDDPLIGSEVPVVLSSGYPDLQVPVGILVGQDVCATRDSLVTAINGSDLPVEAYATTPNGAADTAAPDMAITAAIYLRSTILGEGGNGTIVFTPVLPTPPGGTPVVTDTDLTGGGVQAEDAALAEQGVAAGSNEPSISEDGRVVAFRSIAGNLDVNLLTADNNFGGGPPYENMYQPSPRTGELVRPDFFPASNIYARNRQVDPGLPGGFDEPGNVATDRVSFNKFGYTTASDLLGLGLGARTSAANQSPFVAGDGQIILFSSASEVYGGLVFGASNLEPLDFQSARDVYIYNSQTVGDSPPSTDSRPEVTLTSPSDGLVFLTGSTISLGAEATPKRGKTIAAVQFYVNGAPVGQTLSSEPYTSTYRLANAGRYAIRVVATDSSGVTSIDTVFVEAAGAGSSEPPGITVIHPVPAGLTDTGNDFSRPSQLYLNAVASGSVGTNMPTFFANGQKITGTVTSLSNSTGVTYGIKWSPSANGRFDITAQITGSTNTNPSAPVLTAVSDSLRFDIDEISRPLPTISLLPVSQTNVGLGSTVVLQARVGTQLEIVDRVDFYANQVLIGSTIPPAIINGEVTVALPWQPPATNGYTISARAQQVLNGPLYDNSVISTGSTTNTNDFIVTVSENTNKTAAPIVVLAQQPIADGNYVEGSSLFFNVAVTPGGTNSISTNADAVNFYFEGSKLAGADTGLEQDGSRTYAVQQNIVNGPDSRPLFATAVDSKNLVGSSAARTLTFARPLFPLPTVEMLPLLPGAPVDSGGNVTLRARAVFPSTANQESRVEFYANGGFIGIGTADPADPTLYTLLWKTPAAAGAFAIKARAVALNWQTNTGNDNRIKYYGSIISANATDVNTIPGTAPEVTITAPSNGATVSVNENILVTASAFVPGGNNSISTNILPGSAITTVGAVTNIYSNTLVGSFVTNGQPLVDILSLAMPFPSTALTSPVSGQIKSIGVTNGSYVTPDTVLVSIYPATNIATPTGAAGTVLGPLPIVGQSIISNQTLLSYTTNGVTSTIRSPASGKIQAVSTNLIVGQPLPNTNNLVTIVQSGTGGGTIQRVEFFANGNPIGTFTNEPYSTTFTPSSSGLYNINAIAYSQAGLLTTSETVTINASLGNPPSVTLTAANAAEGTATVSGGRVTGINISKGGFGYTNVPAISLLGGGGTAATATSPLSVAQVVVTSPGSNFTNTPAVTFIDGGGFAAAASASVLNGGLNQILVTNNGTNYTSVPAVSISGGGGTNATAVARMGLQLGALTNFTGGTNYTSSPTVVVAPPPAVVGSAVTFNAFPRAAQGTISRLEFLVNGVVVTNITNSTYAYTLPLNAPGTYQVAARAYDSSSNVSTSNLLELHATQGLPPFISIVTPQPGSVPVGQPITVSANAQDPDGSVSSVTFYLNGLPLGAPLTTAPWQTTFTPPSGGVFTITAEAVDNSGNVAQSAPVVVTAGGGNVTATITSPTTNQTNFTLGTRINLSATASTTGDNTIENVEFFRNNVSLAIISNAPYATSFIPQGTGIYTIRAVATDSGGVKSTNTNNFVQFTVKEASPANAVPEVVLTAPLQGQGLTVGSAVNFNYTVTDDDGPSDIAISNVTFFLNGSRITNLSRIGSNGMTFGYRWNAASVGTNTVSALVEDTAGNTASSEISTFVVRSGGQRPRVTMQPLVVPYLAVGEPVVLSANAFFGTNNTSPAVEFYANDIFIANGLQGAPNADGTVTYTNLWIPAVGSTSNVLLTARAVGLNTTLSNAPADVPLEYYASTISTNSVSFPIDQVPEAPEGVNETFVIDTFEKLYLRSPNYSEYSFYLGLLEQGYSQAETVIAMADSTSFEDVQQVLFGYYIRMGLKPTSKTNANDPTSVSNLLNLMTNGTNATLLPDTMSAGVSGVPNLPASPYGATVGQALVAGRLIENVTLAWTNNQLPRNQDNTGFLAWMRRSFNEPYLPATNINVVVSMGNANDQLATLSNFPPPVTSKLQRFGYSYAFNSALYDSMPLGSVTTNNSNSLRTTLSNFPLLAKGVAVSYLLSPTGQWPTNASGGVNTNAKLSTSLVASNLAPMIVFSGPITNFKQGVSNVYQITGQNIVDSTRFSAASLPAGLSIDPTNGMLSGAPVAGGLFTNAIFASNGPSLVGSNNAVFDILPAPPGFALLRVTSYLGEPLPSVSLSASNSPTNFAPVGGGLAPGGVAINEFGTLSGTPTNAGVYTNFVVARNRGGAGTNQVIFEIVSPFDQFVRGLSGSAAQATADPDNDGRDNAQEFAFGTDPSVSDSPQFTFGMSGTNVTLRWNRRINALMADRYELQASSNLSAGWSAVPNAPTPRPIATNGSYETVEVNIGVQTNQPSLFYRVRQNFPDGFLP